MLLKNYHFTFFMFLMMGSILAISSNSWFTSWLGLEINLMSMIPLILINEKHYNTEVAIKYFIPQAMASTLIMISALMYMYIHQYMFMDKFNSIMMIALIIKAGLAPFHLWFPQVMMKAKWQICMLLISWQKIAPFIMLSNMMSNFILKVIIFSSILVGSLGGFNQNKTKLIMTYSSITHGAWMIIIVYSNYTAFFYYFLIYCLISFMVMLFVMYFNMNSISNTSLFKLNSFYKYNFIMSLMSLGGLPPLLGFLAKLNAILILIKLNYTYIMLWLIAGSLISLFFYLKILYNFFFTSNLSSNLNMKNFSSMNKYNILSSINIFINLLIPMLMFMT